MVELSKKLLKAGVKRNSIIQEVNLELLFNLIGGALTGMA